MKLWEGLELPGEGVGGEVRGSGEYAKTVPDVGGGIMTITYTVDKQRHH